MGFKSSNYQTGTYWPDRPPTAKQYAYAWQMSNILNIQLPNTLDIGEFSKFIEFNKENFNKRMAEIKQEIQYQTMLENMEIAEEELIGK